MPKEKIDAAVMDPEMQAFAQLMGVSVRTLQNWEQGRSQPSGAAQTLIKVAQQWPEVLRAMA